MDERIDEVVAEIEAEQALGRVSAVKIFRSILNQPNLVAISSVDGVQEGANGTPLSQSSFSSFTCNLPRPCLDVSSIQLVASNIPQAQSNIPNSACMFWYYRCSEYSGTTPNINNLYYNRMLPTTYKQEFVRTPAQYGWNRTFKNYKDLATELLKMGTTDLTFNNEEAINSSIAPVNRPYIVPFIPGDISITLNTEMNKFQMTGNNVFVPPTYNSWAAGTIYAEGDMTTYYYNGVDASWTSLQDTNQNHLPDDSGSVWWVRNYNQIMAMWDDSTNYGVGRYVTDGTDVWVSSYPNATQNPNGTYAWSSAQTYSQFQVALDPSNSLLYTYSNQIPKFNRQPSVYASDWIPTLWNESVLYVTNFICIYDGIFYVALKNGTAKQPDVFPTFWNVITFWTSVNMAETNVWNRYLITGYQDPTVAIAQGDSVNALWTPYSLYEVGQVTNYQGNTSLVALWSPTTTYASGDYVRYNNEPGEEITWICEVGGVGNRGSPPGTATGDWTVVFYEAVTQNIGTPPLPFWDATKTYSIGSQVLYNLYYYQSILSIPPNLNKIPTTNPNYWTQIRTEWKRTNLVSQLYGFAYMSRETDFLQENAEASPITFPEGNEQPYAPIPKRLLNSILGFSWNGVFQPSLIKNFNISPYNADYYTTSAPVATLLNRLRPVPIYDLLEEWESAVVYNEGDRVSYLGLVYKSLQDDNTGWVPPVSPSFWALEAPSLGVEDQVGNIANLANVFTADGYANLVYSSIIYIYTSIAGASSLDTSRNTNLLAITPMNAGNLGVAFSNQFIDNPLNKIAGDIYSVYIELRDEFGEPYLLSNNAVATFMLKVRYFEENLARNT